MIGVHKDRQRLAIKFNGSKRLGKIWSGRGSNKTDMQPPLKQRFDLLRCNLLVQHEAYPRQSAPEGYDSRREGRNQRGRRGKTDLEFSDFPALRLPHNVRRSRGLIQRCARLNQQRLPCSGQFDAAIGPIEQFCLEADLKGPNLLTQWRLRNAETFRSPAEMQFFGQDDKISQVAQFHNNSYFISIGSQMILDTNITAD